MPSKFMFVFAISLFSMVPPANAELTPFTCKADSEQEIAEENRRHDLQCAEFLKEQNLIDGDYENEVKTCAQMSRVGTEPYAKCVTTADEKRRVRTLEVDKKEATEKAIYKNKLAEMWSWCSCQPPVNLKTCQDYMDQEDARFAGIELKYKKEINTLEGQKEVDEIDCAEKHSPPGTVEYANCIKQVSEKSRINRLEIEKKITNEVTIHKNKLLEIQSHCKKGAYIP